MNKIIGFLFKQFSKFGKMPASEIMDAARRSKGKYTATQLREGLKKVIARTKVLKPSKVPATSSRSKADIDFEKRTKKAPTKVPADDSSSSELEEFKTAIAKDHDRIVRRVYAEGMKGITESSQKIINDMRKDIQNFFRGSGTKKSFGRPTPKPKGKKPQGKKPQGRVLGRTLDDIFAEGRGAPDNPLLATRAGKTRLQKFWDKRTGGR